MNWTSSKLKTWRFHALPSLLIDFHPPNEQNYFRAWRNESENDKQIYIYNVVDLEKTWPYVRELMFTFHNKESLNWVLKTSQYNFGLSLNSCVID